MTTDLPTETTPDVEPAAVTTTEPERTTAQPVPGTERRTALDGILLADCENCEGILWSMTDAWDWEHIDTDAAECEPAA